MSVPAAHAAHDTTLIAGHAAGDLAGTELLLANRLLAACDDCARLHADLRALANATRALPAAALAPRDFRISRADAERLRRGGILRRLLRPFAGPSPALQPLAAAFGGLGALGLALVLLLPAFGGPAALPAMERNSLTTEDAGPTAAPNVDPVPGDAAAAPTGGAQGYAGATAPPGERPSTLDGDQPGGKSEVDPDGGSSGAGPGIVAGDAVNPATLVLIGSIALLGLGLALFVLRTLGRRLG